jgi:hypothetical protein
MHSLDFAVGDHVGFVDEPDNVFEVIATRLQHYTTHDGTRVEASRGADYVLRLLNSQRHFEPFRYTINALLYKI